MSCSKLSPLSLRRVRSVVSSSGVSLRRLSLGRGLVGVAARCGRGVLLCVCSSWPPYVIGQITVPYDLWCLMSFSQQEKSIMSFFAKPSFSAAVKLDKKGNAVLPSIPGAPTVASFLCSDCWPDGEVRERATLVVLCEDSTFKVCLSEKNLGATLWASCGSWEGLLEALEDRLTSDHPDWRKQRVQRGKKG